MADEIELKLALAEADQARLRRHPLLRAAGAPHAAQLDNIYYDTPDLALHRRGIALRLRRQGRQWLQTVKLAGESAGGLSTRPEWELPYGGHFDFSTIDHEATSDWLQRPKLLGRLTPVFETRFRRLAWHLPAAQGYVELTLDRGWIIAGGRREAISEIEMELKDGADVAALFAHARQLAERLPVAPAQLSKAERGYRMHLGIAPAPVKAAALALDPQLPVDAAFRHIALSCLSHLQYNHEGAVVSSDPEYIHQMRVATRRLRAALRLFQPVTGAAPGLTLHAPLRDLMQRLGRARDLDVLLTDIAAPVLRALPDEPRVAALVSEITERRYQARAAAVAALRSPRYGALALAAMEELHQLQPDAATAAAPLTDFATARLRRLQKKVRRLGAAARTDDPRSLHALRIGIKRLRYALEFFGPQGKRRHTLKLRHLAELQDTLGQLNDLANAGALLMACAGNDARLREAVSLIGGWHGQRYATLLESIEKELAQGLPRLR